jgi:hypothetical protein
MADTPTSSMTLTNVSSGLNMSMSGTYATLTSNAGFMALAGYDLSSALSPSGLSYDVVTVNGKEVQENPANVVVVANYVQTVGYDEVDLDLQYTAIPTGTSLQIESPGQPKFSVSKRTISGTSNLGLMGNNLGPISTLLTISLWIPSANLLTSQSSVSISMNRIESSSGGPEKKTLLGKVVVNLSK